MGAILMSATGASAAISVASQGYVDAKEHGIHRTMKARNVPFTRQTLQLTQMI